MPDIDIDQLPLARLEYRRSRNLLQRHRWALVVEQNGKAVNGPQENYSDKEEALEQALKSCGFQPLTIEGVAALSIGATFTPSDGTRFPELKTVHGHNTHYRIRLVGWPKAWVTKSARD